MTPAFAAEYANIAGVPVCPFVEAMLTIRPLLLFALWGDSTNAVQLSL